MVHTGHVWRPPPNEKKEEWGEKTACRLLVAHGAGRGHGGGGGDSHTLDPCTKTVGGGGEEEEMQVARPAQLCLHGEVDLDLSNRSGLSPPKQLLARGFGPECARKKK